MAKYLIDANLPRYFALWHNENYIFQHDIDVQYPDSKIWQYAKANNLVIITKDSDFSSRILLLRPPPKVIHIKLGNMKMNQFHEIISRIWNDVCEVSDTHKLVNVFKDRIEGIE